MHTTETSRKKKPTNQKTYRTEGLGLDLSCFPPLMHGSSRFEVDDRRTQSFRAHRKTKEASSMAAFAPMMIIFDWLTVEWFLLSCSQHVSPQRVSRYPLLLLLLPLPAVPCRCQLVHPRVVIRMHSASTVMRWGATEACSLPQTFAQPHARAGGPGKGIVAKTGNTAQQWSWMVWSAASTYFAAQAA